MKKCSKCNQFKAFSDFYKCRSHKDGLMSFCKACDAHRGVKNACLNCGEDFTTRVRSVKTVFSRRFCSVSCGVIYIRKKRPQLGSKNPNWKNGATSQSDAFYNSKAWKEIRKQAFERDNYTCCDCGQRGGELEANHIKPRSRFPLLALVLDNIETLCKLCHHGKKWMVYAAA